MNSNLLINYSMNNLTYYFYQFWIDFGDRRMKSFLIYSSGPYVPITISIIYLYLVMKFIPNLMKSREAFKLQAVIKSYNIILMTINAFYFIFALRLLNYGIELLDMSIPSDEENSPNIQIEMKLLYFYHITKLIDYIETIFFALRKKTNQISFLHLYHHIFMVLLTWIGLWYRFNSKPGKLFILVNSFVHVVMYSYYFLSSFGPKIHKYLWWKKYITQLQMIQFVILGIYGAFAEILGTPYPKLLKHMVQAQIILFFYMFYDFYNKSYRNKCEKHN
jgi:hypothetical protein